MDLHVAIVARGLPTLRYPLHGIFEWDQAKALSKAGIQVDFFAVDLRSFRRLRPWGITHGHKDGITWHCFSIPIGRSPLLFRIKVGVWALQKLYENVFRQIAAPDIIHAHFDEFGFMAAHLSKRVHVPFVVTEHRSSILDLNLPSNFLYMLRESHSNAARVIAVSSRLKECIQRSTGVEAEIIPNIVSHCFSVRRISHQGFVFVSTGALEIGKRHRLVIEAFASILAYYDAIKLEIIGDGNLRKELQALVADLNISNKVTFHGTLAREQIAEIYRQCDCFVLPSAYETFGVVYIEAMAAGLPVIATRCGGPEDFVTEVNGILVDVDDVEGLKDAMMKMCEMREAFDGERISADTLSRFSPRSIANQLENIYTQVLWESTIG